jgi:hypothetical protein
MGLNAFHRYQLHKCYSVLNEQRKLVYPYSPLGKLGSSRTMEKGRILQLFQEASLKLLK